MLSDSMADGVLAFLCHLFQKAAPESFRHASAPLEEDSLVPAIVNICKMSSTLFPAAVSLMRIGNRESWGPSL